MTNKERQTSLERKNGLTGENAYCILCEHLFVKTDIIDDPDRPGYYKVITTNACIKKNEETPCATAYNRLIRG